MWSLNYVFIFVSDPRPMEPINLCQCNGVSSIVMGFVNLSEINFPHVCIIGEVGSSSSYPISQRYSGKSASLAPAMSSSIRPSMFIRRTLSAKSILASSGVSQIMKSYMKSLTSIIFHIKTLHWIQWSREYLIKTFFLFLYVIIFHLEIFSYELTLRTNKFNLGSWTIDIFASFYLIIFLLRGQLTRLSWFPFYESKSEMLNQ